MNMKRLYFALGCMQLLALSSILGAQNCTPTASKKQEILSTIRTVNNLELAYFKQERRYGSMQELLASKAYESMKGKIDSATTKVLQQASSPIATTSPETTLDVVTDGKKYLLMLRNSDATCKTTWASSSQGVIYQAEPLR